MTASDLFAHLATQANTERDVIYPDRPRAYEKAIRSGTREDSRSPYTLTFGSSFRAASMAALGIS